MGPVVLGLMAVGLAILVLLAVRADSVSARPNPLLTAVDVALGLAFVVAGGVATGPRTERLLVAAVGVAWLAGSVLTVGRSWHQAVLILALAVFPTGRLRGAARWLCVGLAVPVAAQVLPQFAVAVVFAVVAGVAWTGSRGDRAGAWFSIGSATAMATWLGWSALMASLARSGFVTELAFAGYEVVLVTIAVAFPLGARTAVPAGRRLADRLLSDDRSAGLDGLTGLLGMVLGDPAIAAYFWDDTTSRYVGPNGEHPPSNPEPDRWVAIEDHGRPVAGLAYRTAALGDPPTRAAVTSAVRLAVAQERLQLEQRDQLRELEASRARIVAAADRQRARVAEILRTEVTAPLAQAREALQAVRLRMLSADVAAALDIAAGEIADAATEIDDLVGGSAPAQLGGGRLGAALETLAARSPVPVKVSVAPEAIGTRDAETALYYVCSEALVNALKHAAAKHVSFDVVARGGELSVAVTDYGCGGADPEGAGLKGLADRLAARRGRLRVVSPPGAGTVVTATTPR